ncbi:hypothetical protein V6N13_090698 [Hibiscus sabdariffa]
MRNNIVWTVGLGHEVDFWYGNWLGEIGPLIHHILNPAGSPVERTTVASMRSQEGERAWQLFEHLLPHDILLRIAVTKGPSSRAGCDWIV